MSTTAKHILVTGGAGFIGSAFVLGFVREGLGRVTTLDKLTYAASPESLAPLAGDPRHELVVGDICDAALVRSILREKKPDAIVHFAAESHVDRSIDGPAAFVQTNVVGTFTLLEAMRDHVASLSPEERAAFRFVHVSTDEVFGSLGAEGAFTESSPYSPRSPYSASKAASDHLARAYHHTYGLPTIVTNCSNNYGPRQFPEKLIPLMTLNCVERRPLPVYGTGANVRDWIFVEDHTEGILAALLRGAPGETYLFGGRAERTNLEVVHTIADLVDELTGAPAGRSRELVTYVKDRPGHDFRYAIDPSRSERELGWAPRHDFTSGLRATVSWYLANLGWCADITSGRYKRERLGLGAG